MITTPTPIKDALKSRRIRRLLPTDASAAELAQLAPEILEQSLFSARTHCAGYLSDMDYFLTDLIKGKTDPATVRLRLKQRLKYHGYDPEAHGITPGSLKDLSSDSRTNLIIEMQEKFAHGYAQHEADQDPALLDMWPCYELVRHESRKKERIDWPQRFVVAGGQLYGERMIARKDSPVWSALSVFGYPYPPFDYMSGMGLDDIERAEAEALGIIDKRTVITPKRRPFNESVETSLPKFSNPDLQGEILKAFGKDIVCAGEKAWLLPAGNIAAREAAITAQTAAGTGLMQQVIDTQADIYNALYVPEIGPVDFRWGNAKRTGVAKIISRRDEQAALRMPKVIIKGEKHIEKDGRLICIYDGHKAILDKTWNRKPVNRWLLNGYEIDPPKAGRKKESR